MTIKIVYLKKKRKDCSTLTTLNLHGRKVDSVFQLLGSHENDITFSMAWALSNCPTFLDILVYKTAGIHPDPDSTVILIQDYKKEEKRRGFTDIEITDNSNFHIIIEAKRGWIMPTIDQLSHYAHHIAPLPHTCIVTLSECSIDYAACVLPETSIEGIPIKHLPWLEVYQISKASYGASNHKQKNILMEFLSYLKGVITTQNQESNLVFIVPLSSGHEEGCPLSYIDIVNIKHKYYCKIGANGLKLPPNYIAFRYGGKLQTIHHIDGYTVTRNMHNEIPEMPDVEWDTDHFVFQLGPEMRPPKEVKTGKVWPSGRKWAMLDTLFTSETISEAHRISEERMKSQDDYN